MTAAPATSRTTSDAASVMPDARVPPARARRRTPRVLPSSLPRGTARLAAVAATVAATTATAWALGDPHLGGFDAGMLLGSAALLGGTIALGLRMRAILIVALVVVLPTAVAAEMWLFGPNVTGTPTIPAVVALMPLLAALVLTMRALRQVNETRSFRIGLAVVGPCLVASNLWPALSYVAVADLTAAGAGTLVILAAAPAPFAWMAVELGRAFAFGSVPAAVMRDGLFRLLASAATVVAVLWFGSEAERKVARAAMGVPLESLAPTAGWVVAVATGAGLLWLVLRLPTWLTRAQLDGRYDASAVGETLAFVTGACVAAFVAWRVDATDSLGRAMAIAIAGSAAYTWCRLRFGAPLRAANAPLWIVIVGEAHSDAVSTASSIADDWRVGQVTLLASPEMATRAAGDHARLAGSAGALATLFPTRAAHLEDWSDAQPDSWRSLPVRELYAPAALWPTILGQQVEPSSVVLALARSDPPSTAGQLRRVFQRLVAAVRWRETEWPGSPPTTGRPTAREVLNGFAPDSPVTGAVVPSSLATRVRPTLTVEVLTALVPTVLGGRKRVEQHVKALQPAPSPTVVRYVAILSSAADRPMAERVARRLQGQRDDAERLVECWTMPLTSGPLTRLLPLPAAVWRYAGVLAGHLSQLAMPRGALTRVYARLMRLIAGDDASELDLVTIESDRGESAPALPANVVESAIGARIVSRLVSVRLGTPASDVPLTYPVTLYSGEVRVVSASADAAATQIAEQLLSLSLQPMAVRPQPVAPPPPEPEPRKTTPVAGQATAASVQPPDSGDSHGSNWTIWEVTPSDRGSLIHRFLSPNGELALESVPLEPALRLLNDAPRAAADPEWSRSLSRLLLRNETRVFLQENLLLLLDDESARLPWELLRDWDDTAALPFALRAGLIRTSRGTRWAEPRRGPIASLMINAGPAGTGDLSGMDHIREVAGVLQLASTAEVQVIDSESTPGAAKLLLEGDWTILHVNAGIVGERPAGLLLEPEMVFSGAEFRQLRRLPNVVFVNSHAPAARSLADYVNRAANFGRGLLEVGVRVVVVNGWPIDPLAATTFATRFYEAMFAGVAFGDAVRRARQETYRLHPHTDTWGAYQCYGEPMFTLR